ncbi:hypothetical protein PENSPDRAFT_579420 [Peniophora sp. CONT]|nr:hypothetical protein PENSPDRAFT_579420 [Peniophora sp. CONT]
MPTPLLSEEASQAVLSYPGSSSGGGEVEVPPLEVRLIAGSGPSGNRVDLTFFSDGYTSEERHQFFKDVKFLVDAIAANQTYHTVAPLMNFWAAYTPSKQSGVGVYGLPLDTPFGLYRDGTELRGLYYAKPEVARAACDSLGSKCDYPVLVGNDQLYGGLGGEFVTITPSPTNGPLVLRHELGHSVINVGEEYDGGYAYFGVNAAAEVEPHMPWEHWMSSPPTDGQLPHVERAVMPLQDYAWTMLNASTPWKATFKSAGTYARHLVRFSLSGLPYTRNLKVTLDGVDLGWEAKKGLGIDRWHYDIPRDVALDPGKHEVAFHLKDELLEGSAQLCSVEILEFGHPDEFNAEPGFYGVFPTFSETNETSYRPTNEDCLMRITNEPNFCSVCIEGLWMSLLSRVELIEDSTSTCVFDAPTGKWTRELSVDLVDLTDRGEYITSWSRNGLPLPEWANATRIEIPDVSALGEYSVDVRFVTEEIRADPHGYSTAYSAFTVEHHCRRH